MLTNIIKKNKLSEKEKKVFINTLRNDLFELIKIQKIFWYCADLTLKEGKVVDKPELYSNFDYLSSFKKLNIDNIKSYYNELLIKISKKQPIDYYGERLIVDEELIEFMREGLEGSKRRLVVLLGEEWDQELARKANLIDNTSSSINKSSQNEYEKVFDFHGIKLGMSIEEAKQSINLKGYRLLVGPQKTAGNIYLGMVLKYKRATSGNDYKTIPYNKDDWEYNELPYNGSNFGGNAFKFVVCQDGKSRLVEIMFLVKPEKYLENNKSIEEYFNKSYKSNTYKIVDGNSGSYIESFISPITVIFQKDIPEASPNSNPMSEITLDHTELQKLLPNK